MESIHLVSISQENNVSISVDAKRMNKGQQEILNTIFQELRTPVSIMESSIQLLKMNTTVKQSIGLVAPY